MDQCWLKGVNSRHQLNPQQMFMIGRSHNSNLVLNHMSISKEHAVINYDYKQSQYILKDLQSVNGCVVNNVRHKHKILLDGDNIVFGKDIDNQFIFIKGKKGIGKPIQQIQENDSYLELDRKIQVIDLNNLHQPIQNGVNQQKQDQQSNGYNSQQQWNQKSIEKVEQQKSQDNYLQEQLLEKEDILVEKDEEMKRMKNDNELLKDEKMILQQQLQAIKQYMNDLQMRLQVSENEQRMFNEKTPDSEKRLIESKKEIEQLRQHLNDNRLEMEFYQKQMNRIGEGEKYGKIIEQLQKEVIQCRKIKQQYENRENECGRQWGQLIQENHNKQQKVNMLKGQIEQIQKDQQTFYQQCEDKMQKVNNQLLEILESEDINRQQFMAGQLLVNEMGNMQDENQYLNEQNMKSKSIIDELTIQINQQQREIDRYQQQGQLREKVEELNDLVYELRTSHGIEKVQELEIDNRRLQQTLGMQETELKEYKDKVMKRGESGNEYGEDMVQYFSRLIKSKDNKIVRLIEQIREEKNEHKQMEQRVQTLSEQVEFMKGDRQKQMNVDYRNNFQLTNMNVDVDIPDSIMNQFKT